MKSISVAFANWYKRPFILDLFYMDLLSPSTSIVEPVLLDLIHNKSLKLSFELEYALSKKRFLRPRLTSWTSNSVAEAINPSMNSTASSGNNLESVCHVS